MGFYKEDNDNPIGNTFDKGFIQYKDVFKNYLELKLASTKLKCSSQMAFLLVVRVIQPRCTNVQ